MTAAAPGRRAGAAAQAGCWRLAARAMPRPGLRQFAGLAAGLAVPLLSGGAVASMQGAPASKDMTIGRCRLTVPHDWRVEGSTGRSPDGVVTIQIRTVSSGQAFVRFQRAFGVRTSPIRDDDLTVMFTHVGSTWRYYAAAPASAERACTAQITSSNAARREEAFAIARSLRRLPR